jgi:hypothetical protein
MNQMQRRKGNGGEELGRRIPVKNLRKKVNKEVQKLKTLTRPLPKGEEKSK